ncbi:RecQ family ATP-dependent DNA helicase [Vagococcus xieshaowenii]|uniref:ATP-dependent DNA helicase RecQ n=1 Tax=Vagococcus xieshaowenii TaxID=2562451 RepID=A0AAJ5EDP8_9ENTE|nr:ATP-dependent DNA helicase RecQ [Vagococcus xieshaowenii]QCA28712.1 ATP-dependent DNA helicase RecQ [Vagococcus xieshaowenii]TFZ40480.1 ATP-dependent DNA helicase RecQ [Vagococcus xieshaowenii]
MDPVIKTLRHRFGFETFREGQEETIRTIISTRHVLSILPTGSGKSLCYQLTSYLLTGQTIIVSPLISLMEDQVRRLIKQGEKSVVSINGQLSAEERQWIFERLATYKFIFVTPESLMNKELIYRLKRLSISLFVVDEAHCISTWGIDFRPDYERLHTVIHQLSSPRVLALTATATSHVIKDIEQKLYLNKPVHVIKTTVNRPNIYYHVEETNGTTNKNDWLESFVKQYAGPGMIYCTTRKDAEGVYRFLKDNTSVKIAYYHGGMNGVERANVQEQFIKGQLDCLVATSAFGMGVDKADIRYVIHYQLPNSLEAFVQESGRAGRDGKQSVSVVLFDEKDQRIHHYFRKELENEWQTFTQLTSLKDVSKENYSDIQVKWLEYQSNEQSSKEELEQRIQQRLLEKQLQVSEMMTFLTTATCRRQIISDYFEEPAFPHQDICCDNCNELNNESFPIDYFQTKNENNTIIGLKPQEIIKKLFNS